MYFDLPFCHPKGLYIRPASLALFVNLRISFVDVLLSSGDSISP
jgi:hypothetical protein